ncbi:MAG: cold shock domain-containing protein [Ferruginibacter sp.]
MAETWNKKEREKKKRAKKKEKQEKKLEKKENATEVNFEDMLAYIDENGNLSDTPPDPKKMKKVNADDIEIGVPRQADINPEDLIRTGVVTHFNHDKGYGFIKDSQSSDSIFVHINSVKGNITEQSKVTFEVEMGQKGANAVNVVVI